MQALVYEGQSAVEERLDLDLDPGSLPGYSQ